MLHLLTEKLALVEQSRRRLFEGGLVEEPEVVGHLVLLERRGSIGTSGRSR